MYREWDTERESDQAELRERKGASGSSHQLSSLLSFVLLVRSRTVDKHYKRSPRPTFPGHHIPSRRTPIPIPIAHSRQHPLSSPSIDSSSTRDQIHTHLSKWLPLRKLRPAPKRRSLLPLPPMAPTKVCRRRPTSHHAVAWLGRALA